MKTIKERSSMGDTLATGESKINNTVIEVLSEEHGKEVKKYWESKGFDTSEYSFAFNERRGDTHFYYGVIYGEFGNYSLECVKSHGAKVIELPKTKEQLPIPRHVLVRDSIDVEWERRELLVDMSNYGVNTPFVCRDETYRKNFRPWI